jgi:hypothetical protein
MIMRAFLFIALLALSVPSYGSSPDFLGAWRQTSLKWITSPPEIEPPVRCAEATILYFGVDHSFLLVYGTVIQSMQKESLSVGDGRVVYLGTWSQEGHTLRLAYRLVDRFINYPPRRVPGPVERKTAVIEEDVIQFDGNRLKRRALLDADLEVEIRGWRLRHPEFLKTK